MRLLITTTVFLSMQFATLSARADGLIYQLPADGTSSEYDLEAVFGEMKSDGTVTISSVGKETVDGEVCRWIEFKFVMKLQGNERTIRAKALVPESELVKGKSPVDHVKKAWFKPEDRTPKDITDMTDNDAGPVPAFLAGPFKDSKELPAEKIKTGLGELSCKGVSGSTTFKQGRSTHTYEFTNFLNEKAPFGVAKSTMKFTSARKGGTPRGGTITLTAKKISKNAVSEIKPKE